MQIRYALETDRQTLEDFLVFNGGEQWRLLAKEYIACMFSRDFRRPYFVVAEENDKLVGSAAFSEELFTVGIWGISWVNVHTSYRNKGLGEKLVRFCMDEIKIKTKDAVTIILNTYPDKTALYDKMGFIPAAKDHEGGSLMIFHTGKSL